MKKGYGFTYFQSYKTKLNNVHEKTVWIIKKKKSLSYKRFWTIISPYEKTEKTSALPQPNTQDGNWTEKEFTEKADSISFRLAAIFHLGTPETLSRPLFHGCTNFYVKMCRHVLWVKNNHTEPMKPDSVFLKPRAKRSVVLCFMLIPTSLCRL